MSPSPSHPCRYGRSRAAASRITDHLDRSSIAPRMRAFLVPRSSLPYAAGTLSMPSLFSPYVYWALCPLIVLPPSSWLYSSLFRSTFPAPSASRASSRLHLYHPSTISCHISIYVDLLSSCYCYSYSPHALLYICNTPAHARTRRWTCYRAYILPTILLRIVSLRYEYNSMHFTSIQRL